MQTNPSLPAPEKTSLRSVLLVPLVVLAVLIGASYLTMHWILPAYTSARIYHQSSDGWQQMPRPGGYPEMLHVSTGGTVWVRTSGRDGLSRWDGTVWQHYKETELGSHGGYVP